VIENRSGGRRKRINLFCGLNHKFEPIFPFLTDENCNAQNFERWFERLLHSLYSDAVIVMDNARFHRKAVLFDLIKRFNELYDTQFSIIFLPPYSPDFNPIEKFFGILKEKIKRLFLTGWEMEDKIKHVLNI